MDPDLSTVAARLVLAGKYATKFGVPVDLLCALAEQESSWNPWADRYEAGFYVKYIQPMINSGVVKNMTEARDRATSFGLCQVMGQVARELGFTGRYLTELCNPDVGLEYGARKLAACLAGRSWEDGLLRYNGGADPAYPHLVLDRIGKYQIPNNTGPRDVSSI